MLLDKEKGIHQPPLKGPKLSHGKTNPAEFFNKFTENVSTASKTKAGAVLGFIVLALVLMGGIVYLWRRCCRHRRDPKKSSMYDASTAIDFDEDTDTSGVFGLLRKKAPPPTSRTQNLNIFMDDRPDEDDGDLGSPEKYDKPYSDVPQCGKTII